MQHARAAARSLRTAHTSLRLGNRNFPLEVVRARLNFAPLGLRHGLPAFQRSLHTALWPPLVFAQLLVVLWVYKVRLWQMRLKYAAVLDADSLPEQVNLYAIHPAWRKEGKY